MNKPTTTGEKNMNNEETTTTEFDEALRALDVEIKAAIARSISHDESVAVSVDGSILGISDATRIVFRHADDCDSVRETARLEDVWGTFEGYDFRLKLYVA
jgi:hypothetical protein